MGGFGALGNGAAQMAGGINSRTTSRGGQQQIEARNGSTDSHQQVFYRQGDNSGGTIQQGPYKKLVINSEAHKPPSGAKQDEKEKSQADYQLLMQNFAANNFLAKNTNPVVTTATPGVPPSSKVPLKAFQRSKFINQIFSIHNVNFLQDLIPPKINQLWWQDLKHQKNKRKSALIVAIWKISSKASKVRSKDSR